MQQSIHQMSSNSFATQFTLYMNINDCVSHSEPVPQNDFSQQPLRERISRLSIQCLRSSEKIFNTETYEALINRFDEISQNKSMSLFLEEFLQTLLSYAIKIKQQLTLNISKQDYQVLEKAIQKSEAQIRNHFKIEQQLKLYLDSLEEKIEQLSNKLQLEEHKYLLLFENFKQLDDNHKKLLQQLSEPTDNRKPTGFNPFQSIQATPNDNIASRKTKIGLKNRILIEKFQQRTRKTNEKKRNQMLNITEDEVNLQGSANQMLPQRASIDRYKKDNQTSIKELTKSLHMKHDKSADCYNKRTSKLKTESNQREGRSNSILA